MDQRANHKDATTKRPLHRFVGGGFNMLVLGLFSRTSLFEDSRGAGLSTPLSIHGRPRLSRLSFGAGEQEGIAAIHSDFV